MQGAEAQTVNTSVTILISLSDHLIDLIIRQFLTNGCHDMTELSSGDEAVVITIKNLILVSARAQPSQVKIAG